ncbi:AI-2E family transporter [Paenibacillus thermoaerophilus]|uniref:AI-2E family transporter n=1 Tax=Paenibacillus thermoaerophilus TaxID=1215385 RepID=A0ABW2V927_9BACL|nr:AI-2E family transporter [Paenibacillus thermoaerophilus]TMV17907.1 AI-2E family transporter [Paenibacillus thermoaerophilus]
MLSFYKKYYRTAFDIALIVLTVYLFMLAFSFLYKIAAPIFLSFVIYAMIEPLAAFLHRRGMKKAIASAIATIVFVLTIITLLVLAGIVFAAQITILANRLPDYFMIAQREFLNFIEWAQEQSNLVPQELTDKAADYSSKLAEFASTIGTAVLMWFVATVSSVSTFIVNFVIGIILAYFLSSEIEFWKKFSREKVPRTFKTAFFFLRDNVFKGIVTYLKAQAKLVSITFLVIWLALLALGVDNSFSIAVLSAIFDVLPLLGVPLVFIPWIAYLLITGQTTMAIILTALLLVVMITRQVLEPKITGNSLGVSGFTMLSFMIISLSLFGVAGLILSPILIILLKALLDQGYLQKWIRMPVDEFDGPANPPAPPQSPAPN